MKVYCVSIFLCYNSRVMQKEDLKELEEKNKEKLEEEMVQPTQKKSKRWITAAFLGFSLAVVAVIAILEFGGDKDRSLESHAFNFGFLALAVGCFAAALLCETVKYSYLLYRRRAKCRYSRIYMGFSTGVIGKYYDNITPSGIGGQGFQMYHLAHYGSDAGTAAGLPIIGYLGLQFSFVIIALFSMIFGNKYLGDLVVIRATAIAGLVCYAFMPFCIVFFAIAPKFLERIIRWGTKMGGKLHILKHPDTAAEKVVEYLRMYTDTLREFARSASQVFVVAAVSVIYQLAFMSLPYFVLHFFGANIGFVECFCRVVYIYCAMTLIITPGNSGGAEAGFYMVFSSLSGGAVFWGMLVWRVLCYYSWIILGAIIQLKLRLRENKEIKEANDKAGS